MIRKMLLAGLALVAASPAAAQDWRLVTMSGDSPQRMAWLLDAGSIRRDGNTLTVRTQTVFENTNTDRDFDRSVHLREADCTTISSTIVAISYYAGGKHLSSDEMRGNTVTHRPGTVMHAVVSAACGQRGYIGGPYSDPEAQMRARFVTGS